MKIGIVGVGLLGSSLAVALKNKLQNEIEIVAFSSESTLEKARAMNLFAGFHSYDEITTAIDGLDILFLCSPIKVILNHIEAISKAPKLNKTIVITDVGSTKRLIMDKATKCFEGRNDIVFIGGHPMAGNEFKGIDANDKSLYENAIYVLTPMPQTEDDYVSKLLEIVKHVGAIPMILEPEKHDRAVAGISHLPQMMASGLVDMISKEDNAELSKTLSAGGFRDMTRIASSQYRMWEDIVETNKDNINDLIDRYISELTLIKESIKTQNLESIFENARNTREQIQKGKKGLLQQSLFEIFVRIPDEPGMILKISTILAEENLNIKDISIQHSREQDGGQFRLGFATFSDSEKAVECLTKQGYFAKTIE